MHNKIGSAHMSSHHTYRSALPLFPPSTSVPIATLPKHLSNHGVRLRKYSKPPVMLESITRIVHQISRTAEHHHLFPRMDTNFQPTGHSQASLRPSTIRTSCSRNFRTRASPQSMDKCCIRASLLPLQRCQYQTLGSEASCQVR